MTAVTAFIGNSEAIAKSHYLHATDGDFEIATKRHNQSQQLSADGVQQVTATGGTNSQETKEARENRAVLQPLAAGCETLPSSQVPPRGVEPLSLD